MKKIIIILILIFSFFLSGSTYESTVNKNLEYADKNGIAENIPSEAQKTLEKIGINEITAENIISLSFNDVISLLSESIAERINAPIKAVAAIVFATLICALFQCFSDDFSEQNIVINSVSSICSATVIMIPLRETIIYSSKIIQDCSGFMLGFIPVYSSAIAASGYVSSSAGFHSIMMIVVTVISRIASEIVAPLICIYLAMSIVSAVTDFDIGEISKTLKNFAVWVLGISMTVFTGIMGFGTLITSSGDSAFSKTAKFVIGSAVPVVGGTVSDLLSTVKGCLVITKNVLGVYAVIVIAVIFIPAIISLFSWKICLSLTSGIGGIFGNKSLSGLLLSASSVCGIILSLVTVTAIMFIFSVSIMLMTGG